ncbi:MAG: hypothetical protein PHG98_03530 [Bacteroidales bacterium]|nr:hypothetical protein [Bacteroidales bacterium]MDD4739001.1 hypothetical protein [Bacteroidales bacterium]
MTTIKNILAIALLVIFAVSCTNEEDLRRSDENIILNNKSLVKIDTMMYEDITDEDAFIINENTSKYELVNYSDNEMISILNSFDALIKNNNNSMPPYDIAKALFAMETYLNYALINKQTSFDTSSYSGANFSFTIPLNTDKKINPNELRNAFMDFIGSVLENMGNKYLQYSDLYIENITSSQITFNLSIPPFAYVSVPYQLRGMIVRIPNDFPAIPSGVSSDWNSMHEGNVDQILRFWSKKYVNDFYLCLHTINSPLPSLGTNMYSVYMSSIFYDEAQGNNGLFFSSNPSSGQGSLSIIVNATIVAARYFATKPANNPNNYTNIDIIPTCHIVHNQIKWISKQGYFSQMKFGVEASVIMHDYLSTISVDRGLFL